MHETELTEAILKLSDADAIKLLQRMADGVQAAPPAHSATEAVISLAANEPSITLTDGEAARLALQLLATDPKHAGPIGALLINPPAKQMLIDPITGTLLTTGLLLALQTHVEFIKKPDGTWSLKVIKKPTKDGLLGPLIKKLAALLR